MWTITTLILTLYLRGSWACPSQCTCDTDNRRVNCYGKGLAEIPSNIPVTATELDLQQNRIQVLQPDVFKNKGLLNLRTINLEGNLISTIGANAFRGLKSVMNLNLRQNRLTEIPSYAMAEIRGSSERDCSVYRKCYIDLRMNEIAVVKHEAFYKTKNISILLGTQNVSMSLQNRVFDSTFVHMINIGNLPKLVFDPWSFASVTAEMIKINSTFLPAIPNWFFRSADVMLILFAHTNITGISEGAFSHIDTGRKSSPYGAAGIYFENSVIDTIPQFAFRQSRPANLVIDESQVFNINIFAFETLRTGRIWIRNSSLPILERSTFSTIESLETLSLEACNIDIIKPEVFRSRLGFSIYVKGKPGVPLTLKPKAFSGWENSAGLTITNIDGLEVEPLAFSGMRNHKKLSIEHSNINPLVKNSLAGTIDVKLISIKDSTVKKISLSAFEDRIPGTRSIVIERNHYPCSCEAKKLAAKLKSSSIGWFLQCSYNGSSLSVQPDEPLPNCDINSSSMLRMSMSTLLLLSIFVL